MNLVDAVVEEVISDEPRHCTEYGGHDLGIIEWWEVDVIENCYGRKQEKTLRFPTKAQAKQVSEGYEYTT
jgi:hypothetical protein